MNNTALKVLVLASVLSPAAALAQASAPTTAPTTATVITKEEIAKISATEQPQRTRDENAKVVDIGDGYSMELGIIHRGSTRTPAPPRPAGAGPAEERGACGRTMAALPSGGIPGGLTHDTQTEGYYITSGGGTAFIDGYIVNGRHSTANPDGGPNGPSCGGTAIGAHKIEMRVGDVIIVPAGVVHGWADIPDHVDYITFRPSHGVMKNGWVNPTIASK